MAPNGDGPRPDTKGIGWDDVKTVVGERPDLEHIDYEDVDTVVEVDPANASPKQPPSGRKRG